AGRDLQIEVAVQRDAAVDVDGAAPRAGQANAIEGHARRTDRHGERGGQAESRRENLDALAGGKVEAAVEVRPGAAHRGAERQDSAHQAGAEESRRRDAVRPTATPARPG